jgi:hypothetical protein
VARVGGDSADAAVVGFGGVDDAGLDGVAHGVFSGQQLASQPWNRTTDRRLAAALAAAEAKLLAGRGAAQQTGSEDRSDADDVAQRVPSRRAVR